jgi:hypothetical protein
MRRFWFLLLCFLVMRPSVSMEQPTNSSPVIHGHVVDATGRPVRGALVQVLPLDRANSGSAGLSFTVSDSFGAFHIRVPFYGEVAVFASGGSEDIAYSGLLRFQGTGRPAGTFNVTVSYGGVDPDVDVRLVSVNAR